MILILLIIFKFTVSPTTKSQKLTKMEESKAECVIILTFNSSA